MDASNLDNEPVIVKGIRTPMCRAHKGFLAQTRPEVILTQLFEGILKDTPVKKEDVDNIILGNAIGEGCLFVAARGAQRKAGFPETVPLYVLNRLCSSGIDAINNACNEIRAGQSKIVIAGGYESMTLKSFSPLAETAIDKDMQEDPIVKNILTSMGITNENICEKYNITRKQQDEFALNSHMKAFQAQEAGEFKKEIMPITRKDGQVCDKDETIRGNTNMELLEKLKPCFKNDGSTTAGNSSPLTDGGALVLVMTRKLAKEYGMEILGTLKGFVKVGVDPLYMGISPSVAIPKVLEKYNYKLEDIDAFEINEAFAGQAFYCIQKCQIDPAKVNINGGALSMGHPLGCSGARLVISLNNVLTKLGKKRGIVSMCVGTGEGIAAIFEKE